MSSREVFWWIKGRMELKKTVFAFSPSKENIILSNGGKAKKTRIEKILKVQCSCR
jgi:hypothetical protein